MSRASLAISLVALATTATAIVLPAGATPPGANGKIVFEYTDMKSAVDHVERTYAAVKALKGK